jgi:hypothetical protein
MKSQRTVAVRLAIGVGVAAWVLPLASVAVAQDTPYYFIRNHGNPKLFLNNRGGEVVASAIEPQACIGGQWALEPGLGDTTVRIRHRERNVYLQVEDGRLVLGALRPDWAPRWFVEAAERQLAVRFRNAPTDLYLALHELTGPPAAVPIDPDRDVGLLEWELVAGADCFAVPLVTAPALRPLIVLPGRVSPIRVPVLRPPPAPFPPGERPPPGKQLPPGKQPPPLKPPPTNGLPPLKPPPEKFPRPGEPPPSNGGKPPEKFPRPGEPPPSNGGKPPEKFPRPGEPPPSNGDKSPPERFPRPDTGGKTIPREPPPRSLPPIPETPEVTDKGPRPRPAPSLPTIQGVPNVHYTNRPPVQKFRPNTPRVTKRPVVQRPAIVRPKPAPRPRVAPVRRPPRAR